MGAPYIYDISRLRVKDLHSATYIYVVRRLRVNLFMIVKSRRMKWTEHVALCGRMGYIYIYVYIYIYMYVCIYIYIYTKFQYVIFKWQDHLEDVKTDKTIIQKLPLKSQNGKLWTPMASLFSMNRLLDVFVTLGRGN